MWGAIRFIESDVRQIDRALEELRVASATRNSRYLQSQLWMSRVTSSPSTAAESLRVRREGGCATPCDRGSERRARHFCRGPRIATDLTFRACGQSRGFPRALDDVKALGVDGCPIANCG